MAERGILGIIGGAGVGAAAALYEDVSARYHDATGGLPPIVLWNLPLTREIELAFLGGGDIGPALVAAEALVAEAVDRLAAAGATVVAMPCNTLQLVAARESARAGLPFVDMIASTVEAARGLGFDEAVLLATGATYAGGFYDGHGVEMIAPTAELRAELAALIGRLLVGPPPAAAELERLIERARTPGACVMLGCTDICGLVEPAPTAVVESLGCLAQSCVEALAV